MNNSLYTTIPKVELLPPMTPEEEAIDYATTFEQENLEVEIPNLFTVYCQIEKAFYEAGYNVTTASRPINEENPFKSNYGLQTPKKEVQFLTGGLDDFGIEYIVKSGAYKNASGRSTNKRFSFVELRNGIADYYKLYEKTDQIPFLVGDVQ